MDLGRLVRNPSGVVARLARRVGTVLTRRVVANRPDTPWIATLRACQREPARLRYAAARCPRGGRAGPGGRGPRSAAGSRGTEERAGQRGARPGRPPASADDLQARSRWPNEEPASHVNSATSVANTARVSEGRLRRPVLQAGQPPDQQQRSEPHQQPAPRPNTKPGDRAGALLGRPSRCPGGAVRAGRGLHRPGPGRPTAPQRAQDRRVGDDPGPASGGGGAADGWLIPRRVLRAGAGAWVRRLRPIPERKLNRNDEDTAGKLGPPTLAVVPGRLGRAMTGETRPGQADLRGAHSRRMDVHQFRRGPARSSRTRPSSSSTCASRTSPACSSISTCPPPASTRTSSPKA